MADTDEWRWNGGGTLVSWSYVPMARGDGGLIPLDLEAPEPRRAWLRGLLARLPALLGDFAYATESRVAAWPVGEDACVIDWRTTDGPATLLDFVGRTDAVHDVEVLLTLTCLDRDLEPFEIEWGARLIVSFALTDSGVLNTAMEIPVDVRLVLYADPYAPRSPQPVKDRAVLAAINGPRLTAFLERIERDIPAQFLEFNEEVYRGAVDRRGFLPAPGAARDA